MKAILSGLVVGLFLFAGLATAKKHTISEANRVAVTSVQDTYSYDARHDGRDGQLIFGAQEVSFDSPGHPKHSMSWNYNMIKKIDTHKGGQEVDLVFHGGETQVFKLKSQAFTDDVANAVMARVAVAPKPEPGR